MNFQTGYIFVEFDRTTLRRRFDPQAIALPAKTLGFLDLLRVFRLGEHASWQYGTEWTVLGVEQFLLSASDPADMARHIHDHILYDPAVYNALAKLDASLVVVCD